MFEPRTPILVVDDAHTIRSIIVKTLKNMGFLSIDEAHDGKEAWEMMGVVNPPFGLIICDWNMPNMTGLDLLKAMRSDARFNHLPFLMLTAENDSAQVLEAIKAGVTNYVVKPFTSELLTQKLQNTYQKVNARR